MLDFVVCVMLLSYRSLSSLSDVDNLFDSESSNSEEGLDFFAEMDDGSSKEDLDFFVALEIASVVEAKNGEGALSGAPLAVVKGRTRQVGVSKRRGIVPMCLCASVVVVAGGDAWALIGLF
jgi:hypothetical protein